MSIAGERTLQIDARRRVTVNDIVGVEEEGGIVLEVEDPHSIAGVQMSKAEVDELIALLRPSEFPVITGRDVSDLYILKQHAGEGSLGDTAISISGTTGLGGFSLIVTVSPPDREVVVIEYDGSPIIEAVAAAVLAREVPA